jgi:polyhydroxyalkanoate synthase
MPRTAKARPEDAAGEAGGATLAAPSRSRARPARPATSTARGARASRKGAGATAAAAAAPSASAPASSSASASAPASASSPVDSAEAFGATVGSFVQSLAGLGLPASTVLKLQQDYVAEAARLWNLAVEKLPLVQGLTATRPDPVANAGGPQKSIGDRRFAGSDWAQSPSASWTAQMYLLNSRTLMRLADSLQGDEKTRARVRFAVQQFVDAMSPSNYFALNPDAQKKALATGGESIAHGVRQLIDDLKQGHLSQTDETVFEIGRNVATTEGTVVFENDYLQLIEYTPLTDRVHERPILFVPPCINKYYILDLQPENSLIRYTVAEGHRVFVVSWRNPDEAMAARTWDDYIEDAVIRAIRVVQEITGADTINTLGFCVGGTLLSTALGVLAARGEHPAESLTLLTTFLDFSDTGVLDLFIDEASVQMREITLGEQAPGGPRLLKGGELATTFSFLRPNDLVWNYVVGNYLKGEKPPAFDLLYWNSDSTNLPGPWFCWYLRHTYLSNELRVPKRLTVCGERLDLSAIEAPTFLYGSREDHIVPWKGAFESTRILGGPKRFVLGASGHIAGVINPPAAKKRSYWTNDDLKGDADAWFAGAKEHAGSWWPAWSNWLAGHAGKHVAAPKAPGSRAHKAIEPAPGRYVKQKA